MTEFYRLYIFLPEKVKERCVLSMTSLEQLQELINKVPEDRLDELKMVIEGFLESEQQDKLTEKDRHTFMRHIEEVADLVPPGDQENTSIDHDRILYG